MKIKSILIITLFLSGTMFAQTDVKSGMSFLKIGFGARNIALGDVGVISASNSTASAYNPALLTLNDNSQITLSHNSWMTDVRSEMLGAKFYMLGLPFAAYINSSTINNIELRQKPGEALGTFNVNYFAASLSSAFNLNKSISVGGTVKFLYQGIYADEATGWAFDFGAVYKNLLDNLNLTFAVRNIGSMNQLKNDATKLPASVSAGAGYFIQRHVRNFSVELFTAVRKYIDDNNFHLHSGAEVGFKDFVFVRAGYITGYEARSYSVGLGLNWRGFNFDYAFAPFDYALGNSNIISIQYTF